jgi:hypothetical protein
VGKRSSPRVPRVGLQKHPVARCVVFKSSSTECLLFEEKRTEGDREVV